MTVPHIPYGRQDIRAEDIEAVASVLRSDWLTQGPMVPRFETALAKLCGAGHAVVVNSATSALHIACVALGLGPGDRLWTSPNTFTASANCGLYCGAQVDFVDIDLRTGNMSADALAAKLDAAQRQSLMQSIRDRGIDYVVQEAVTLSSMPVWRDGRLQPRPFTLRLFLAKVGERWQVMPGGFVRIADSADARAVSLQRGAATADAWVLSHGPVGETTLLPTPERMQVQRASGLLPSRAADNLFWVGRYVERAEATLRLVRAMINRSAEADDAAAPVIGSIGALLAAWNAIPDDMNQALTAPTARAVLTRSDLKGSLPYLAGAARSSASMIRDRFSPDAWRAINDLAIMIGTPLPMGPAESAINDRVEAALRIIASLSGLAQENMTQLAGWRFLELGRRIERAIVTCRFVRQFGANLDRGLDTLLELADSRITYRQRYVMVAARAPVIDLTLLDPSNPRSVAFQFDQIEGHLEAMPHMRPDGRLSLPFQITLATAAQK